MKTYFFIGITCLLFLVTSCVHKSSTSYNVNYTVINNLNDSVRLEFKAAGSFSDGVKKDSLFYMGTVLKGETKIIYKRDNLNSTFNRIFSIADNSEYPYGIMYGLKGSTRDTIRANSSTMPSLANSIYWEITIDNDNSVITRTLTLH